MFLSKNIRYLRKKNNYSQEDLSQSLGYKSFTTINKWESGKSDPPTDILIKLADLFKVNLQDLITRDFEYEDENPPVQASEADYQKLIEQAKADGIEPEDIQAVIELIKKYRKKR